MGARGTPPLREIALGLMKEAAECCGMTLGEVKALLFVTTLAGPLVHCCIGTVEEEAIVVQSGRRRWKRLHPLPNMSGVAVRASLGQFLRRRRNTMNKL